VLDAAVWMSENGVPMWIRHVLVPGITTDERELKALRDFIDGLKTVMKVEVLPYHTLGVYKYEELGIPYSLADVNPPTEEEIIRARKILGAQ
ncbi:MAG: pyruvate formate lyase 1-activating protein, partial [Lachnospiraceae bacterium]|nr:pyruvate formate lyase 1-activating protein [Lachnospiraceae bacterium]